MKDTDLIKHHLDIVSLIGEYVQLKPSGINHKGLCPFHQEKSPSFMVNRERQSWHCFGCNKGGDIFSFVQEIEGMDFVEALKLLAQKAGIELTNTQEDKTKTSQKQRIKDINAKAASFFHHILMHMDAARDARVYLDTRGLTEQTRQAWQIGYIPDQWDLLTKYMFKKGYAVDDLIAAGLTIKRDNADPKTGRGYYDRFRGRIMFPIWDVHGNVVGFTGRVLVETEKSGGKYVNTPQTPVYDKSSVVFGLNKAKQEIRKKNAIVMVEGQMDVIACHQAGMTNVVATSGTALTSAQITLLKRYSDQVLMAFDADDAGVAAAKRGIDIAIEQGMYVRVIEIPPGKGKDPDECIKQDRTVWFHAVEKARPVMEWYFARVFDNTSRNTPREKQQAVDALLPDIIRIPYSVERNHWLQELAARVGVEVSVLLDDAKRMSSQQGGGGTGATPSRHVPTSMEPSSERVNTRTEQLFERILAGVLVTRDSEILQKVHPELIGCLHTSSLYPLYEILRIQYTPGQPIDMEPIRQMLPSGTGEHPIDVLVLKSSVFFEDSSAQSIKADIQSMLPVFHDILRQEKLTSLEGAIRHAEAQKDTDAVQSLLKEVQRLHSLI